MPTWWERGGEMPSIEERVAFLEGRFADDVAATADLRTSVNESRHDTNSRFTELRHDMNARFAALDEKLDRQFSRLLGMQVAVLLAVVSALVGAYFR